MTQTTLFDFRALDAPASITELTTVPTATTHTLEGMPPSNGVDTSQEAAESIAPSAASIRARVYQLIVESGGMTCDEIEVVTGLTHVTTSPRLWELEGHGKQTDGTPRPKLIYKSDDKRPTRSGRMARVYRAVLVEAQP